MSAVTNPNFQLTQTDFQSIFIGKANVLVGKVIIEITKVLLQNSSLSTNEFTATYVRPRLELLDLDKRTDSFFKKILGCIAEDLLKYPFILKVFAQMNSEPNGDSDLAGKIVTVVAYPFVKELIAELDDICVSIINDMIA